MVYIKLKENSSIIKEKNNMLDLIFKIKNNFEKIEEKNVEDKVILNLPNLKERTLEKVSKYMKQNCIGRVCLSNELLDNEKMRKFMEEENIKVFDGKWLFKHLLIKTLEYIATSKKERIEYQEISMLTNDINEIIAYNIKEIASRVKIFNIVTENEKKFKKIEKELYTEKGIILNINNNYKKSLIKSDIILNFDFGEEEVNRYILPKKACIINLKDKIKINSKAFDGININFYEIPLPRKYLKDIGEFKDFDSSILYESFIYKNTNPVNISKELDFDEINIKFLDGIKGKIRKNEYLNLSKKIAN